MDFVTAPHCSESLPNPEFVLVWVGLSIISIQIFVDEWLLGWIQVLILIRKIPIPCSASVPELVSMTYRKPEIELLPPVVKMH